MQITHVAVAPDRTVHKLTEEGCNNLQRLHKQQLVKGWQYGHLKDVDSLIAKIAGANPAVKQALDENQTLKNRIAELEKLLGSNADADLKPEAPKDATAKASTGAGQLPHWMEVVGKIQKATTIEEAKAIAGNDTRTGVVKALGKRIAELSKEGDANA